MIYMCVCIHPHAYRVGNERISECARTCTHTSYDTALGSTDDEEGGGTGAWHRRGPPASSADMASRGEEEGEGEGGGKKRGKSRCSSRARPRGARSGCEVCVFVFCVCVFCV